jgi:hypothetical protein
MGRTSYSRSCHRRSVHDQPLPRPALLSSVAVQTERMPGAQDVFPEAFPGNDCLIRDTVHMKLQKAEAEVRPAVIEVSGRRNKGAQFHVSAVTGGDVVRPACRCSLKAGLPPMEYQGVKRPDFP